MKSYIEWRNSHFWLHGHITVFSTRNWSLSLLLNELSKVNYLFLAVIRLGVVSIATALAAVLDVANLAVLETVEQRALDMLLRDGLVSLLQDSLNVLAVVSCEIQ